MALRPGGTNQITTNTIYGDSLARNSVKTYVADGAITPGHAVQLDSSAEDIVIAANSGTSTQFLGIAGDHTGINLTTGVPYEYNAAYAAGQKVPVITAGLVRATSDGTTTAGNSQIVAATDGQLTDGTTAGRVVGVAYNNEVAAGAGGFFMLQIKGA